MGMLDGKVAVITGAGSGMAKASAKAFVREGARVVAADVSGAQADTANELGDGVVPIHCDVSNEADITAMMDAAIKEFGQIDILLNVAGISYIKPLHETPIEEYDRTMNIMLRGVFLGTKHAVPAMLDNGGGSIVNWASIAGMNAGPNTSVYSAAKAGVISLTKSTAIEYAAQGIRANAICPGFILTEGMGEPAYKAFPDIGKKAPIERPGESDEVAELAVFLASDRSAYITGTIIPIDGGRAAKLA